jgi:hypothetical protein
MDSIITLDLWTARTRTYLLQVGKFKHNTSTKHDSGGKGVSFNETFDFYLKTPPLNKEQKFLKIHRDLRGETY